MNISIRVQPKHQISPEERTLFTLHHITFPLYCLSRTVHNAADTSLMVIQTVPFFLISASESLDTISTFLGNQCKCVDEE